MGLDLKALILVTTALLLVLIARPSITRERGGRVLSFVALLVLPVLAASMGFGRHIERTKHVDFCLSCHVMEPYGRSLRVDDDLYIPADHFQNRRIDRTQACYVCHTSYAMYGDLQSKLRGLRHLFRYYSGSRPDTLRLYEPFNNRECLHCHDGARSFMEGQTHTETDTTLRAIRAGRVSCVSSGCHDSVHDVHDLDALDAWEEPTL